MTCLHAPQVGAHLGNKGADVLCRLAPCLGRVKETAQAGVGTGLQAQLSHPQGGVGHPKWEHTPSTPNRKALPLLIPQEEGSLPLLPTAQPIRDRTGPAPGSLPTLDPGSSNGLWLSQPLPAPPSPSSSKSPSVTSGFACGPPLLVYPGLQSLKKLTFAGEITSYVVIRVAGQAGSISLQKL